MEEIEEIFDEVEVLCRLSNLKTTRQKLASGLIWYVSAFSDEQRKISVFFYPNQHDFAIFLDYAETDYRHIAPSQLMTTFAKLL